MQDVNILAAHAYERPRLVLAILEIALLMEVEINIQGLRNMPAQPVGSLKANKRMFISPMQDRNVVFRKIASLARACSGGVDCRQIPSRFCKRLPPRAAHRSPAGTRRGRPTIPLPASIRLTIVGIMKLNSTNRIAR
jgi:hypothetical protein